MGRYDSFFACDDTYPGLTISRGQCTTSGDQVLAAGGTDFLLSGAPDVELSEGQIVSITDNGVGGTGRVAYCRVMKRTTSPSQKVLLLPVQTSGGTTADSASVIGLSFKSGATITGRSVLTDVLTLVIDLTDAPPASLTEAYTYVFAVAGSVMSPVTSNGRARIRMLRRSLVGDPLGGAGSEELGDAIQGIQTGNQGVSPFNFVFWETSLTPGQRYEFRLLVGVDSTTLNSVRVVNPRIWAARVKTMYTASQVSEVTTTSTLGGGGVVQVCTTGAVIPAGTYLVLASWLHALTTTGGTVAAGDTVLTRMRRIVAANNFFRNDWSPLNTNEYTSRGYAAVQTLGANEDIRLNHAVAAAGSAGLTSRVKQAFIAVVQFADQAMTDLIGRAIADGTNSSLTASAWNVLVDSDQGFSPQSLNAGTWVEFLAFANPAAEALRADWNSLSMHGADLRSLARVEDPGTVGTRTYGHFFMSRHARPSGNQKHRLLTRTPAATTSQTWAEVNCSFIREADPVAPRWDTPVVIAAEMQVGVVYKLWTTAGTDKWQIDLPNIALVDRVTVNGTEYTLQSSVGNVNAAQEWFWDVSARRCTIQMDTGDSPNDQDRTVVLGVPFLLSREADDLTDDDGVVRQYYAQMDSTPNVQQSLVVKGAGCEVAQSFGRMRLQRSDRTFDDILANRIIDGMRLVVYRGWRYLTTRLRDCQRLLSAALGRPKLSAKGLDIEVHDASLTLKRPVATATISIYEGSTQRADKLMPVIYGTVRRVPAYRTTNNGSGTETYRVTSAHQVKNIGAINASGGFDAKAYKDGEIATPGNTITVTLSTASFTIAYGQPEVQTGAVADVVYVDVQGITDTGLSSGTALTRPGEIARHLAVTYGGYAASSLVEASFRLLDRSWRQRRSSSGALVPLGVNLGLYLTEETVADALSLVCQASFAYWGETRTGRLRVGVPDIEAANLLLNGSWESDSVSGAPWAVNGNATITLSTTVKYFGARAAVIDNGKNSWVFQRIIMPAPGDYLATCVAALQSGNGDAFCLGVITPDEGLTPKLSDPITITSSAWARANAPVTVPQGGAGSGQVLLLPYRPVAARPAAPSNVSSMVLWLDAAQIEGKVHGDAISTWSDLSGSGNHATQGTAAKQPTYAADAIAGHPAVRFDGCDDALVTPLSITSFGITVFVVYRVREWNHLGTSDFKRVLSGSNNWLVGPYAGTNKAYVGSFTPTAGAPAVDPFKAVVVTLRQANSASSFLYVNGVLQGSENTTAAQTGPGTINLGAAGAFTEPGAFDVAEVIVFSRALNATRRSNWEEYLMAKWGVTAAAAVVDMVRTVPVGLTVAAEVDRLAAGEVPEAQREAHARNATIKSIDLEKEVFYEARVPYNVNTQKPDRASAVLVTESEARGLLSSYDPSAAEGRAVLRASGRLDMGKLGKAYAAVADLLVANAQESGFGVAAAMAYWFGRQRNRLQLDVADWQRVPDVGTFLYVESMRGVPRAPSEDPLWLITEVDDASNPVTELGIEATREMDPVADRDQISPSELPLGAICVCTASACPTDWEEVTTQRGLYVQGGTAPDQVSILGAATHRHSLDHTHTVPAHQHTAKSSAAKLGASATRDTYGDTIMAQLEELNQPGKVIGPSDSYAETFARGPGAGDHSHDITTGNFTVNNSAAVSAGAAGDTPQTYRGSNDVKHINILLCRKTGKTVSTIPSSIVLGYYLATAPTGWARQTSFYDRAIRGCDPGNVGFSGRSIAAHTQTEAATTITPSTLDDVLVGQRITVTEGANTYRGIVTSINTSAGTFTLQPTHETGDTAAGTAYTSAATIAAASCDAGTTVDPPDHLHVRNGADGTGAVEAHTHRVTHSHTGIASGAPTVGYADATTQQITNPTISFYNGEHWQHSHAIIPELPAGASDAGAAQGTSPYGGTLTGAKQNAPARFAMAFINNGAGTETVAPVGARILWDGVVCPVGWSLVASAANRLIAGASSGAGDTVSDSYHVHQATFAAHAFSHNHGGSVDQYTEDGDGVFPVGRDQPESDSFYIVHDWGEPSQYEHVHAITINGISTVDPTLQATGTVDTGTAQGDMPYSRRLLVCQRN